MRASILVLIAGILTHAAIAGDIPVWVKESLRTGSGVHPAQDVAGRLAPRDLATAGVVWMETDPDFGPGTVGRSRLLLTLAVAPVALGETHADDSVTRVLLRYWSDDGPAASTLLRALERSSPLMRPESIQRVREHWFDENWATTATALKVTARLGGVSTEAELALMKEMVERPEAINPRAIESAGVSFRHSIPASAAFVVLSSPLRLDESVEWAAGLQGDARRAAFDALLSQMLVEDGTFAQATPELRVRWLEVFGTMLCESDRIKVNDYAMPLWIVMQRHPECAEQASRTLVYLHDQTDDVRLRDGIAQMVREAGYGKFLQQP